MSGGCGGPRGSQDIYTSPMVTPRDTYPPLVGWDRSRELREELSATRDLQPPSSKSEACNSRFPFFVAVAEWEAAKTEAVALEVELRVAAVRVEVARTAGWMVVVARAVGRRLLRGLRPGPTAWTATPCTPALPA